MKRILMAFMIMVVMILGACGTEKVVEAEKPLETEMTDLTLIHYFGEVTWRLVEAYGEEPGSYEQKSFLDAAIAKSDSSIMKLEEVYDPNIPVMVSLKKLAEYNKMTAQEVLAGDRKALLEGLLLAEELIAEMSNEYLDGEVPFLFKDMTSY